MDGWIHGKAKETWVNLEYALNNMLMNARGA
jgi:hypothetical protein